MSNEEMAERIKAGERDLTLTLWEQVHKLIIKIIYTRYLPRDGSTNQVEIDDLLQAGFIAMTKAVGDFDSASGFAFTTYLTNHFKNAAREVLGIRSHGKKDPLIGATSLDQSLSKSDNNDLTLSDTVCDDATVWLYDDLIDATVQYEEVKTILGRVKILNPLNQEIFRERYVSGLNFLAIAERHQIPLKEARSRAREALRRMRNDYMIRLLWERRVDHKTRFYRHKGVTAFRSSWTSATEDTVLERERIREHIRAGV